MARSASSALLLALVTLVTLAACASQPAPTPSAPAAPAEKNCTEEAKLCPDGSAVGRTGPNCEFAACPGQ